MDELNENEKENDVIAGLTKDLTVPLSLSELSKSFDESD